MGQAQGQRYRLIRKRRRPSQRVLDRRDDLILVLTEVEHIAVLIEDYEQNDAAVLGLHLPNQRAGAAVGAAERSRLGDYAAPCGWIGVSIFQGAGIDAGNRQNV